MEVGIDGDILLLGEANFSFTLSLLQFCDPKFVTTTCYESRLSAEQRYCDLKTHFASSSQKFTRIFFMFPHVSGRSNLKKNRILIDNFMRSSHDVLGIVKQKNNIVKVYACSYLI